METGEIWQGIEEKIRQQLSEVEFETWFARVKPIGIEDGTYFLGVSNSFAADWMRTHYLSSLENALRELGAASPKIDFRVLPAVEEAVLEAIVAKKEPTVNPKLNSKYIFSNFVVGPNNNMAHAAALKVAEAPGKAYNPLFLYGDVGLGKTHLMHAIGHLAAELFPGLKVEYISTETFTNELISAIREDRMAAFKDRYRSIDVLLVDDIQFIAGKERTQEEFFHTFNALHEAHKQIVLSSDRPPREIPTLEDRLRSRFEWGLITDIQPPDYETRVAILRMNAEYRKARVPNETLEFIAKHVSSNIRELEGALLRVIAYCSLNGLDLNPTSAAKALSHVFTEENVGPSMLDIVRTVADYYGLIEGLVRGQSRSREVMMPRQVAMYLIRELTGSSLPEIGEFFGRDHSTVLYSTQKITEQLTQDPNLSRTIDEIKGKLAK